MQEVVECLFQAPALGGFTHLRLKAPAIAKQARPGQQVIWGERDFPIMRAEPSAGWIELLVQGDLPQALEISGPQGEPLVVDESASHSLLIANLQTLPSLIFLCEQLRHRKGHTVLALLQADGELPFRPTPCRTLIPGMPPGVIATLPLLNDWGIAVRIACEEGSPGCYEGCVEALAEQWLASSDTEVAVVYL